MRSRHAESLRPAARDGFRRRYLPAALLLLALLLPLNNPTAARPAVDVRPGGRSLTGKLLVARPELMDRNFRRTVVFMVKHDRNGALGLIVNRVLGSAPFAALLEDMGSDPEEIEGKVQVHFGGPVDPHRAFVLHSTDYRTAPLIPVDDKYGVTMNAEILKAMAGGDGPKHALLTLGYAGWAKGQLERELAQGGWVVAPPSEGILFDDDYTTKWERAFASRLITI
jgi:putative transcriptional regulator